MKTSRMQTCKKLRGFSQRPSYWMCIATNTTRRNRPLPIPPHHILHSLPPYELREILIRYDRSSKNLASPEPKVRRSRMLPLPESQSPVAYAAFAHGGTRFLVAYRGGLIQLWDVTHINSSQSKDSTLPCEILREPESRPTSVGLLLGEYATALVLCSINFQTSDENGDIVVAVASQSQ